MLFGGNSGGEAWTLDVLTADYLVSGQVDSGAQKWAWTYFSMTADKEVPSTLEVAVSEAAPPGHRDGRG